MTRTIIQKAENYSAVDTFKSMYTLENLKRRCFNLFNGKELLDIVLLPSVPAIYTRAEVNSNPIETNSDNGYYCNFMNLLDMCGIAIPSGMFVNLNNGEGESSAMPFGITLTAPCWKDEYISSISKTYMEKFCTGTCFK